MPSAFVKEKGCLATQRLTMTQKHAEALPTTKGQGREPRPTAWLSGAAPREATAATSPQKEALVSLPAAPGVSGNKYSRELCGLTESGVQVPTDPLVPAPRDFALPNLPVG